MTQNGASENQPILCIYCRRPIVRQRNQGSWYHRRSASSSCYPGSGSWKRATPPEVTA